MHWRTATLALSIALLVLGLWGVNQTQARLRAERELAARYQQAFFEAIENVENVEALLAKGLIASSPEQVTRLFSDLRAHAQAAQSSLTQLPLLQGALMTTSKFLTQVGDVGFTMTKKSASGSPPSSEDMDLLRRLREDAAMLSAALHDIQQTAAKGAMPWEQVRRQANRELGPASFDLEDGGFSRLEQHFAQIPVIQYDGPFSDHLLQREPKGVSGDPISESRAESIALEFVGAENRDELSAIAVQRVSGGPIPGYRIALRPTGEPDRRAEIVMDVSVQGGHVVWMIDKRDVKETSISMEEAHRRAQAFLAERGFENMVATYASEADNQAVIPFVPEIDGALIYPDLVKVTVAMDDGDIVGFEALGYLMSHAERDIAKPKLTADEAKKRISASLTIAGEPRLALIPLETLAEVLTWEVPTRMQQGDPFLVYINAETGAEERILRLIQTGEGAMTI